MRVLIVEDETTAQENLREMLHEYDSRIEILGITEGVKQTINWLGNNEQPDLIFMDIHLSDGSAFTIFDKVKSTSLYLPPKGTDAIVLLLVSSGTFLSCMFEKMSPATVFIIHSPF